MSTERYARHNLIDWFSQPELSASKIAVVGAGAIGNEVIKNLALLGTGSVDVFDFDRVELHNLTRSVLLRESDVGEEKAHALARRAAELDPNCTVRAIAGDIRDTLTPTSIAGYRAVVAAVDNFEARLRLNQLCLLAGVDLINCAIDSRFVSVETYPHSRWNVACYECHLPDSAYQRVAQRYSCGGLRKIAFQENKVATTVITASIAGAMAAAAALRLGERASRGNDAAEQPPSSKRLFCDTHTMVSQSSALARQPGCAACSSFARRPLLAPAGREWRARFEQAFANDEAFVVLPEPIIVAYACALCAGTRGGLGSDGARGQYEAAELIGQRAADHDDRLSWCPRCRSSSMAIELRDRLAVAEFLAIYADADLPPPLGYALLSDGEQQHCVTWRNEFEPRSSARSRKWPIRSN